MRWRCSPRCVRDGRDARLWLPGAREAGPRALHRRTRSARPRSWASPTRSRSRRRPSRSPMPTPPATWCCNSRASPKPSAARCSKRSSSGGRCWAGTTAASANCCANCSRAARCRRSTRRRWRARRGLLDAAAAASGYDAAHLARDAGGDARGLCRTLDEPDHAATTPRGLALGAGLGAGLRRAVARARLRRRRAGARCAGGDRASCCSRASAAARSCSARRRGR